MIKNVLIVENSINGLKKVNEAVAPSGKRQYILGGIFTEFNVKNRNDRIYQADRFLPHLDELLERNRAQFAFIGRSNVGKSSVINSLTGKKDLAITSSFPGRTQQVNIFSINNSVYFIDLPGYGYAKAPERVRNQIKYLINWYFFETEYEQKQLFLIIDAEIGFTKDDLEMLSKFEQYGKNVIIIANKIDKVKNSELKHKLEVITKTAGNYKVIPFSTKKNIGIQEVLEEIHNR